MPWITLPSDWGDKEHTVFCTRDKPKKLRGSDFFGFECALYATDEQLPVQFCRKPIEQLTGIKFKPGVPRKVKAIILEDE